jgi:hypothetical protein
LRYQFNKNKGLAITLLLLVFSLFTGYSQFLSTGQDPFSVRWKQINTDNFKVIYPEEFYSEANRLTNILEYSYKYTSQSLNHNPKKIPVIIHNNSVISNGIVSWAPKRIELVTTPPRVSYAEDWIEQLALHEFRHIVQVDKLNKGVTRVLSWILGQQGHGAVAGYLPFWFLEGDAVVTETALSSTGRGRLPQFEMKLKALVTEKDRRFSYDKMYLGSYKDFIPDYYELGYHMVAYARLKYDPEIFSKILDDVAKKSYQIGPFYLGLKKNYSLSKTGLFEETFDTLKYLWNKQIHNINYTKYLNITDNKFKDYTSYRQPQYLNDTMLVAVKSGVDQIPQFVLLNKSGYEKILYTPGFLSSDRISVCNNKIIWDEIVTDPRWNHRNYSVIKKLNTETGKERQLTRKSRYFSPSVSKDGSKITVVEVDIRNNHSLVILDSDNGKVNKRIPSPGNMYLQLPVWTDDGMIAVKTINRKGNSIYIVDPRENEWKSILTSGYIDISQPVSQGNNILFRGSYSGVDNIYAVGIDTKDIFQVTSSKFGAFDPSVRPGSNELVYTDYSASGYNIVASEIDTCLWIPLHNIDNNSVKWYKQLADQENIDIQESNIPDIEFRSKDYSRVMNLFNVHSWSPFYFDYSGDIDLKDLRITPGFTLLSQNMLSTAISNIGYSYENGQHYFYPRIIYSGFYPVIEFSARFGGTSTYIEWQNVPDPPGNMPMDKRYSVKIYVPLKFTNNKYIKQIRPQVEFEYDNTVYFNNGYKKGLSSFHYKLYMYRYFKTSVRDILPRWGQVLSLSYTHSPSNPFLGSLVSMSSRFYIPGLIKHHSIRIYGGIQKQYPKAAIFAIDRILLPRGYPVYYSKELWKTTIDYVFPVIYPDISLGPFAYVKRIKIDIFYDHAYGTDVRENYKNTNDLNTGMYNSFGFELTADFNALRFIFPFDSGIRVSYMPGETEYSLEFMISVDTSIF